MTRSRREFLRTLAGLGAGAAVSGAGARLFGGGDIAFARDGSVRTINLEARQVSWELGPGRTVNGARSAAPIVKDSVDVEAHMGSAIVEFTAHNPGDWLFHCHKPMHMDGGMVSLVKIT